MLKTWMIADYLRPYAQWRINRADPHDEGRNARAAIGLIDAAAYAAQLHEDERVIVRLTIAGCFAPGRFDPGAEGERIIRFWHYDEVAGGPAELLDAVASAAERSQWPGPPSGRGDGPVAATSGAGRGPSLPRPRQGEATPA